MKHVAALTMVILTTAALVGGCTRKPDPCAQLAARICAGRDAAYCVRAGAFLDRELTGPGGERLTGPERHSGCRLILSDGEVVGAYARQAERSIRGRSL
ncbi:MAG: hypothetical protein ABI333_20960 [bacterium]